MPLVSFISARKNTRHKAPRIRHTVLADLAIGESWNLDACCLREDSLDRDGDGPDAVVGSSSEGGVSGRFIILRQVVTPPVQRRGGSPGEDKYVRTSDFDDGAETWTNLIID